MLYVVLIVIFNYWNTYFLLVISGSIPDFFQVIQFLQVFTIIGSISVVLSIWFLFNLKINKAIIFGGLGSIIIVILVMIGLFVFFPYYPNPNAPFYLFIKIIIFSLLCIVNAVLLISKSRSNVEEEALIKRTVLDLGTKFTRLEIKEISEKCKVDKSTVIEVINNMIENQEIYAEYFKSSHSISFNQQANIDEIDKLMEVYRNWEDEKVGKKY